MSANTQSRLVAIPLHSEQYRPKLPCLPNRAASMPTIFFSHSSRDDAMTSAVVDPSGRGFDDIFVDHHSIRSGDKWTRFFEEQAAHAGWCCP